MESTATSPKDKMLDAAEKLFAHHGFDGVSMRQLYRRDADLFNAVTHSLGYILGERLYYALATGHILKREVRELFVDPLDDEGAPLLT